MTDTSKLLAALSDAKFEASALLAREPRTSGLYPELLTAERELAELLHRIEEAAKADAEEQAHV